jgi:beta-mannosidase
LLADRISPDAVSDDALVTLLPGRSHTFRVAGVAGFGAGGILATGALRHLAGIAPAAD